MDLKHPISLQNKKLSHRGKPLKKADHTIEKEKQEEMAKNRVIRSQRNNAQELSNLANQRSRSDRHITIGVDRRSPLEAAL